MVIFLYNYNSLYYYHISCGEKESRPEEIPAQALGTADLLGFLGVVIKTYFDLSCTLSSMFLLRVVMPC